MFTGTYTALVTPFTKKNKVDRASFKKIIDFNLNGGVDGIVPCGTTGESPTLTHDEHEEVVGLAIQYAKGRGKVIAGTGSNSTQEAIDMTLAAQKAGADGSLQVCPYYNKPSQEGLYQHFKAIAEATKLPIVLYSIPGRSVIEISVETCARLARDFKNIVAVKEAGGSAERVSQLVAACPKDFVVLSGDDSLTLPFMSLGAKGVISVASNLLPTMMSSLVNAMLRDDLVTAREIHQKHYPLLSNLMKLDTNPVPIKAAMSLAGYGDADVRLPMAGLTEAKSKELKKLLKQFKVI